VLDEFSDCSLMVDKEAFQDLRSKAKFVAVVALVAVVAIVSFAAVISDMKRWSVSNARKGVARITTNPSQKGL
jgi:hypothetical protein